MDPRQDAQQSLSQRLMAADPAAFQEIHQRFSPGLRQFFAKRVSDAHAVDELVQATWTELWRCVRLGRYDSQRSSPSTFTYAIAGVLLRRWRGSTRAADVVGSATDEPAHDPELAAAVAQAELLAALRDCVNERLTPEQRELLATLDDEGERGAARALGLAASTIHERKAKAIKILRDCLLKKGFSDMDIERGG